MKITVLTLGCKTNQAESISIEKSLNNLGHQIVDISEKPDICIINTCTVTSKSDYQSKQLIHRALKANSKVVVTGCYAELNYEQLRKIDGDIKIIKNKGKNNIINILSDINLSNTINNQNPSALSRHRPIIKVQDGCNYSCSYCAIPLARGESKSILSDDVINEIAYYESLGYKEVVLTGIHLGTYGLDLKPEMSLSNLVKTILKNTKIHRIRLSSLEINEIDEELLELVTDCRICKHLHIPLQSGDNSILKLMNRTYTVGEYVSGIEKILKKMPDISIGTDVIVGFPGEGEVEFKNTQRLIESIPFSYLHVFPYSKRPNTKAISFQGQVADSLKKERASILRDIGYTKKRVYLIRHLGSILDVIVENRCKDGLIGTAGNYIKVLFENQNSIQSGMLVNAKISGHKDNIAIGLPVNFF